MSVWFCDTRPVRVPSADWKAATISVSESSAAESVFDLMKSTCDCSPDSAACARDDSAAIAAAFVATSVALATSAAVARATSAARDAVRSESPAIRAASSASICA